MLFHATQSTSCVYLRPEMFLRQCFFFVCLFFWCHLLSHNTSRDQYCLDINNWIWFMCSFSDKSTLLWWPFYFSPFIFFIWHVANCGLMLSQAEPGPRVSCSPDDHASWQVMMGGDGQQHDVTADLHWASLVSELYWVRKAWMDIRINQQLLTFTLCIFSQIT